jgi:cellulose synthase/poly-beta-1,6-N-acetylglucosamine synthase-like glycosyltransferase
MNLLYDLGWRLSNGLNVAVNSSRGRYVMILDSKTELTDDAIDSSIRLLINNKNAGIVGRYVSPLKCAQVLMCQNH